MPQIFSGGPKPAPLPAPQPTRADPAIQAAKDRARITAANRRGRQSTILTGRNGKVANEDVLKKTLGG